MEITKRDAKKFEKLLLSEEDRLSNGIRRIEESALHESVRETTGDLYSYAETGTDNFERETALNIATGESQRLGEVRDALKRIENGSYGLCEGCEKSIPKRRLEVFPAARYCVECQSKLEKEGTL
jgi:RNA polymerase-binding protein DksA